jgi:hypothetical protein
VPLSEKSVANVDVTALVEMSVWVNEPGALPLALVKRPVPPVNVVTSVPWALPEASGRPAAGDIAKQLVAVWRP